MLTCCDHKFLFLRTLSFVPMGLRGGGDHPGLCKSCCEAHQAGTEQPSLYALG